MNLLDPSSLDPLDILGDELRDGGMDDDSVDSLVITPEVAQNLALLAPWLKNREPFILVSRRMDWDIARWEEDPL